MNQFGSLIAFFLIGIGISNTIIFLRELFKITKHDYIRGIAPLALRMCYIAPFLWAGIQLLR